MTIHAPLPQAPAIAGIDPRDFRAAMRQLPGGVSVITAGIGEDRTGLTVTSVVSLSADPPTVLVCINRTASAMPVIATYRHFAVNVVGGAQKQVAENFAGRGGLRGPHRYRDAKWSVLETGASVLEGATAVLDCEVESLIERHSHVIVIGRVVASRVADAAGGLIYWRGDYRPQGAAALERALAPF